MKFKIEITESQTQFIAISESEEEKHGLRAQGPYVPIKLVNDTLIINYVSKLPLHPDIIGAICITAFYPFIKYSATMPFPVSKTFVEGLKMDILPQHDKINGIYRAVKPITITNIDEDLEPYNNGKNTVIAYGGGMDSTAIALLFPDFPIIHSSNSNDDLETKNVIKKFVKENLKNDSFIIDTNCKELCKPGGFTTFTNIFLMPLILSADLNIKNICCGEILGASCLSNGKKYFPQFNTKRRNRWMNFYNHIGLNIFSPTAGCSELITSKIVYKHKLSDKVLFCEINEGKPCFKCIKCLRKILELKLCGFEYNFDNFNEKFIINFLMKRPLYFAHIFIETIKNNHEIPPYLKESIKDIIHIETSLFHKIYSKSFIYFPEDIKDEIINKLKKYAEIMDEEEEQYLENWDLT
jgi:hypothetical protein